MPDHSERTTPNVDPGATETTDQHGISWWPYGGNTALVLPINIERTFLHDRELIAIACVLDETRNLVYSATIPRTLRHELAEICCQLANLLHNGPHLKSHR